MATFRRLRGGSRTYRCGKTAAPPQEGFSARNWIRLANCRYTPIGRPGLALPSPRPPEHGWTHHDVFGAGNGAQMPHLAGRGEHAGAEEPQPDRLADLALARGRQV